MSLKHLSLLAAILTIVVCLPPPTHAQPKRPPTSKVEILAPGAGAELQGNVRVRVRITTPESQKTPNAVYFGIGGGPPWVRMQRDETTGEWTAEIDSAMVPNGEQQLTIVTDEKRARAAIQVNVHNPLKVFFADLHSHTSYTDGTLTPAAAHAYARDVAKLDVFSLSDHLEGVDDTEWLDTREVAWDFNEDGTFVAIPGLEWTKKWGHLNIYDPKTRHWPEDPAEFYAALVAAGVVAKFNHPGDGTATHDGLAYSEVGDQAVQMMEVRHPKEEQAFIRALNAGWHIAPEGSDDTHNANWGNCGRWTGILAPGLSKRCIWDAMKNRTTGFTTTQHRATTKPPRSSPGNVPLISSTSICGDPHVGRETRRSQDRCENQSCNGTSEADYRNAMGLKAKPAVVPLILAVVQR